MITADTAVIAAALTGMVAIALFIAGELVKLIQARRAVRREIVLRMIGTIEAWIRSNQLPGVVAVYRGSDLELPLALFRLGIDLRRRDFPVAMWVLKKLETIQIASSAKKKVAAAAEISARLTEWYRREKKTTWFREQILSSPQTTESERSSGLRRYRAKRSLLDGVVVALVAALFAWIVRGRFWE